MKSSRVNSEEVERIDVDVLVKYSRDRIKSVLDSIRQLKASEFPYSDSKDALCRIEQLFENTLERLDATDADPEYIRQLCSISLRHLFICVLSARLYEMIHFGWYCQLWPANPA